MTALGILLMIILTPSWIVLNLPYLSLTLIMFYAFIRIIPYNFGLKIQIQYQLIGLEAVTSLIRGIIFICLGTRLFWYFSTDLSIMNFNFPCILVFAFPEIFEILWKLFIISIMSCNINTMKLHCWEINNQTHVSMFLSNAISTLPPSPYTPLPSYFSTLCQLVHSGVFLSSLLLRQFV